MDQTNQPIQADQPIKMPDEKPVVVTAKNYAKKRLFQFSYINPKILGGLTVLLLLIGGVGAGVYLTQAPQQTTTQATLPQVDLSFQPSSTNADANSEFSMDVFVDAHENQITSVNLALNYDPNILELKSITPKQFLPKLLVEPVIQPGSAVVSLGTDGNSGISGSGILASLNFKAIVPSSTTINLVKENTKINILGSSTGITGNFSPAQININPASQSQTLPEPSESPPVQELPSPNPVRGEVSGDFNLDSQINAVDLSIMYNSWGIPNTEVKKRADINGDGIVNGLDYSQILPKFQQ